MHEANTELGQVSSAPDKTPAKRNKGKGLRHGEPLTPEFIENVPGRCATKGCTFADFHDGACSFMMGLGRGVRRGSVPSGLDPLAQEFQPPGEQASPSDSRQVCVEPKAA